VTFSHDEAPEPGSYGIEAILVSLNLRSPKGTLLVVPDSDDAPRMSFTEAEYAERRLAEEADRAAQRLIDEDAATG
jgi:hypothetical protein